MVFDDLEGTLDLLFALSGENGNVSLLDAIFEDRKLVELLIRLILTAENQACSSLRLGEGYRAQVVLSLVHDLFSAIFKLWFDVAKSSERGVETR